MRGCATRLRIAFQQPHRVGDRHVAHARRHLRRPVGCHRRLLHPKHRLLPARLRRRRPPGIAELAPGSPAVLLLYRGRGPAEAFAARRLAHDPAGALRLVRQAVGPPPEAVRDRSDPADHELRPRLRASRELRCGEDNARGHLVRAASGVQRLGGLHRRDDRPERDPRGAGLQRHGAADVGCNELRPQLRGLARRRAADDRGPHGAAAGEGLLCRAGRGRDRLQDPGQGR
mmetsp:Transcript_48787/g.98359  ORF Transcript_48787/g.98359 Transcript_48787/m.98359 type:complete len:230 (+) Transcript_48787:758-1447(+)